MNYRTGRKRALIAVSVLLLVGCSSIGSNGAVSTVGVPYAAELRGAVFDPPRTLVNFSVASTTGEDFTLSDHQGQLILLYFGYRSCPDFCPTTFAQLRRIYTELNEPADKLKIVFVTIDPERDTMEYMRQYTAGFHQDFIGLRAEGQALEQLEEQFGVVAERRVVGDSAMSYLFDHTASLFLIGTNGQLEAQYLYGTSSRDIVHDLQLIFQSL